MSISAVMLLLSMLMQAANAKAARLQNQVQVLQSRLVERDHQVSLQPEMSCNAMQCSKCHVVLALDPVLEACPTAQKFLFFPRGMINVVASPKPQRFGKCDELSAPDPWYSV